MTSRSFMRPAETSYQKLLLDCMYSPFTKITYILCFPTTYLNNFSELSEVLCMLCNFFKSTGLIYTFFLNPIFKLSFQSTGSTACRFSWSLRICLQSIPFDSWVGKICWRRHRLPTPLFLGFLCGLADKVSACNGWDLGLISGKILWRKERLLTPVFWPGEFRGLYSPRCCKELDTTEWLSQDKARKWNLPGPGIKLMSPALAGRFLTTGPPRSPV